MAEQNFDLSFKKGSVGERVVQRFLEKKGFVVYKAITQGAHAFDMLAIKGKKKLIVAEVKSKARRNFYPDTGINYRHYQEYKRIAENHNLPIFIFFVDEMMGKVYGNVLSVLEEPCQVKHNGKILSYPIVSGGIIYFPLCKMKQVATLDESTIGELRNLSQRSYDYDEPQNE